MPSPIVLAVATLHHKSGLPKDADQNSFVFTGEQADAAALAADLDSASLIKHFYDANPVAAHPIAYYLGNCIVRTTSVHTVEYYDITTHLDGSSHGTPVLTTTFNLTGAIGSGVDLPAQDGAVITIHDDQWASSVVESGVTRPKQRHAGRLYIGPMNAYGIATDGTTGECRLTSGCCADLGGAASTLLDETAAITTPTYWAHWSRVLANIYPIVGGHVDNRVDIQRRRGLESTARTTWS